MPLPMKHSFLLRQFFAALHPSFVSNKYWILHFRSIWTLFQGVGLSWLLDTLSKLRSQTNKGRTPLPHDHTYTYWVFLVIQSSFCRIEQVRNFWFADALFWATIRPIWALHSPLPVVKLSRGSWVHYKSSERGISWAMGEPRHYWSDGRGIPKYIKLNKTANNKRFQYYLLMLPTEDSIFPAVECFWNWYV